MCSNSGRKVVDFVNGQSRGWKKAPACIRHQLEVEGGGGVQGTMFVFAQRTTVQYERSKLSTLGMNSSSDASLEITSQLLSKTLSGGRTTSKHMPRAFLICQRKPYSSTRWISNTLWRNLTTDSQRIEKPWARRDLQTCHIRPPYPRNIPIFCHFATQLCGGFIKAIALNITWLWLIQESTLKVSEILRTRRS